MPRSISLLDAIVTGRLGPVGDGAFFADIARAFGAPAWIDCHDERTWTWYFGGLAVSGPTDGRPADSIRLADIGYAAAPLMLLGDPAERFPASGAKSLADHCAVLMLDFDGAARPSAVIDLLASAGMPVEIGYADEAGEGGYRLVLRAKNVTIVFLGDLAAAGSGTPPRGVRLPAAAIGGLADGFARLETIEWCRQPDDAAIRWIEPGAYLSGAMEGPKAGPEHSWQRRQLRPPIALTDFLTTGRLGPIGFPASRGEIGALLGPPRGGDIGPYLDYWAYGALHLNFDDGALTWIQLEYANLFSGDCEVLPTRGPTGPLVIDLEGLSGSSRPSDMVRLLHTRGAAPRVMVRSSGQGEDLSFDVCIVAGTVLIRFVGVGHEDRSAIVPGDPAERIRMIEASGRIDEIYAFRPDLAEKQIASECAGFEEVPASDYVVQARAGVA
ncbi:MAG: hypothetical protein J0H01_30395 [Rhizobiales bacterium]|nr:hypothetical protein [Hyphomicrobiales bacterium]